jgi:hypothetical protein
MAVAVRALREKLGDEALGGIQTFVEMQVENGRRTCWY